MNIKAEIISWSYFSFWYLQNGSRISGPSGCCEVANLIVYLSPFVSSLAHLCWLWWRHVDCIYNLHGHMLPSHFKILFVECKFYGKHFATELWMCSGRSVSYIMMAPSLSSPCALTSLYEVPSFSIWPHTPLYGIITHDINCWYTCIYLSDGTFD